MINLRLMELQRIIADKILDNGIKKEATSIALGISISRMFPIPASEVDSAEQHYLFNVKASAEQHVASFNEGLIVDFDLTLEVVRSYWLIRYTNTYPDMTIPILAMRDMDFMTALSGGVRYVNPKVQSFCNKYSTVMISIINEISAIIQARKND